MDKTEALKWLRQFLSEIPHLRELPHGNEEFELWRDKVLNILEAAFGKNSSEYDRFVTTVGVWRWDEEAYNIELDSYETALKSVIKKHELLGVEGKPTVAMEPHKVFIVHGGKSKARDKLYRFLTALGAVSLIIEEEPRAGRSVNKQVEYYLEQADCAIILGTADDKELKDGKLYPRRNAYIEIGRFQEKFPNRIIYLLEEGASFPSDISEKLYTRFTQESMDEALITVARELKAFDLVSAQKIGTDKNV